MNPQAPAETRWGPLLLGATGAGLLLLAGQLGSGPLALLGAGGVAAVLLSLFWRPRFGQLQLQLHAPQRAAVGESVTAYLTVLNAGSRSLPVTKVRYLAPGVSAEPVTLPQLAPGQQQSVELQLNPEHRGRFTHHAISVESGAPFGLFVRQAAWQMGGELVIHPARRPPLRLEAGGGEGERPTGWADRAGWLPHAIRDYRQGDSVRQVNWRATARRGSLVVVEPERTRGERLQLLVVGSSAAPQAGALNPTADGAPAPGIEPLGDPQRLEEAIARAAWSVVLRLRTPADLPGVRLVAATTAGLTDLATRDHAAALDWFSGLPRADGLTVPEPGQLLTRLAGPGEERGGDLIVVAASDLPAARWQRLTAALSSHGYRVIRCAEGGP